jgi:purine-nucleoside phosphorylase
VETEEDRSSGWVSKCKVRVRMLTLVLGALGDEAGNNEDASKEDAHRTLDWEHHRRTMEIAAVSSSVRRSQVHVHGVESMCRGKFWVEGSDSETESENNDSDDIDQLSCSLYKMSISSPTKSLGFDSIFNSDHPVAIEEKPQRAESTSVVRSVASSFTSNGSDNRES